MYFPQYHVIQTTYKHLQLLYIQNFFLNTTLLKILFQQWFIMGTAIYMSYSDVQMSSSSWHNTLIKI